LASKFEKSANKSQTFLKIFSLLAGYQKRRILCCFKTAEKNAKTSLKSKSFVIVVGFEISV
jgi:hypothetical protein